jgi:Flp pilus assembly pilin Flp
MAAFLLIFWREEDGQDLTEYSLLIVCFALACCAFLGWGTGAVNGMWVSSNNHLQQANATATGS